MINKVKKFLTAKRCKSLLKNNKGFSLLEVLVAVAIIGIISGIAIPQFQEYRGKASLTAGNTSVTNVMKAHQNCLVLDSFGSCNTLSEIKIQCNDCEAPERTGPPFCVNYSKKVGNKAFRMCGSVTAAGVQTRTAGGDFKLCHETCTGAGCSVTTKVVMDKLVVCKDSTDCTDYKSTNVVSATVPESYQESCDLNSGSTKGTCIATTGACQ